MLMWLMLMWLMLMRLMLMCTIRDKGAVPSQLLCPVLSFQFLEGWHALMADGYGLVTRSH